MQIVRSGHRDIAPPVLRSAGDDSFASLAGEQGAKLIKDHVEKQYQKREDFFDIQKKEADSFNAALEGLEGKDHEEVMATIVSARDQLAKIFEGKKLKDYNSPEFQKQLFEIKKNLENVRSMASTNKSNLAKADAIAQQTPYLNRGNVRTWLANQAGLPISKREKDPVGFILSDPQFRNVTEELKDYIEEGGVDISSNTTQEGNIYTTDFKKNYKMLYDNTGKLIISDSDIDQLFTNKPWLIGAIREFYNTPEQNKSLEDGGFDATSKESLRKGFKDYVQSMQALKNFSDIKPDVKQKASQRPTAADTKEQSFKEDVSNLQKRLLSSNVEAEAILGSYEQDGVSNIRAIKNNDGTLTISYNQEEMVENRRGKKEKKVTQKSYGAKIDPNNSGQVSELLSYFINMQKPKDTSVAGPKAGEADKGKKTINGF